MRRLFFKDLIMTSADMLGRSLDLSAIDMLVVLGAVIIMLVLYMMMGYKE